MRDAAHGTTSHPPCPSGISRLSQTASLPLQVGAVIRTQLAAQGRNTKTQKCIHGKLSEQTDACSGTEQAAIHPSARQSVDSKNTCFGGSRVGRGRRGHAYTYIYCDQTSRPCCYDDTKTNRLELSAQQVIDLEGQSTTAMLTVSETMLGSICALCPKLQGDHNGCSKTKAGDACDDVPNFMAGEEACKKVKIKSTSNSTVCEFHPQQLWVASLGKYLPL